MLWMQSASTRSRASATEALYALGHTLMAAGRHTDASDVYRALLLVAPDDERGWIALGACHEAVGQEQVARQLYGAGRVLAKPAGRCEIALARVSRRLGDDAAAEQALDRVEELIIESEDEELRALLAWERSVSS